MEYYCNICCKTIKHKSKKKHINSKKHIFLSPHVTNRYQINNPKHDEIEDILEKNIKEHTKKLIVNWVICKFKTVSRTIVLIMYKKLFKHDNFQIFYLGDVSNFVEIYLLNFCFC